MPEESTREAWKTIADLVHDRRADELAAFLEKLSPADVARALTRLSDTDQGGLLTLLEPEDAADLIEELPNRQSADILEEISAERAAAIVEEMASDSRADVLAELDVADAEAILQVMSPEEAQDARRLMNYAAHTSGGIMVTEYLSYTEDLTTADVIQDLRDHVEEYKDYRVQYIYVTSRTGVLLGLLRLRDLLLTPGSRPLPDIMVRDPLVVNVEAPLHELQQLFDRRQFYGLPVVDNEGRMVGIVRRVDLEAALSEQADKTFMRFSGILGGEEFRSMPLVSRTSRRLAMLTINIFLNLLAAGVIAKYTDTLEKIIALAVFLPIVSDMSGCSGNQAIAVSIRELALGLIQPRDFLRVWWKEAQVGMINGFCLGTFIAIVGYIYTALMFDGGDPLFAIVVGSALGINTLVSVSMGGLIPLFLKRTGVDPAIAAGPMLTTVTDMCGFFLVLSLATAVL